MAVAVIGTLSLVGLCVNFTALSVLIFISRRWSDPDQPRYKASSVVVMSETIKLLCSIALALREARLVSVDGVRPAPTGNYALVPQADDDGKAEETTMVVRGFNECYETVYRDVFGRDFLRMGIPAALFTLQSNLAFIAIANLSVPVFQCLAQLKILTTAIFSVLLLKRALTARQWIALGLLTIGVALVQLDGTSTSTSTPADPRRPRLNAVLGVSAILASCTSSGFASVYFELWLKKETPRDPSARSHGGTLWVRNIQLSMFGAAIGIAGVGIETLFQSESSVHRGIGNMLFAGFTSLVWLIVLLSASGGLLAALVMLYADNILKVFSTSFSIVLSFLVSVILFDFHMGFGSSTGGALVLLSSLLFSISAEQSAALAGRLRR